MWKLEVYTAIYSHFTCNSAVRESKYDISSCEHFMKIRGREMQCVFSPIQREYHDICCTCFQLHISLCFPRFSIKTWCRNFSNRWNWNRLWPAVCSEKSLKAESFIPKNFLIVWNIQWCIFLTAELSCFQFRTLSTWLFLVWIQNINDFHVFVNFFKAFSWILVIVCMIIVICSEFVFWGFRYSISFRYRREK